MSEYLMKFGCAHVPLPTNRIFDYAAVRGTNRGYRRHLRIESPDESWSFVDGRAFLAHGWSDNMIENTFIKDIIENNPTKKQMMDWFENDPARFATEWAAYDSDAVLHEFGNPANPVFIMHPRPGHPEDCQADIGKLLFDPNVKADRSICYDSLLRFSNNGVDYLVDPIVKNEW
jgi:hypothetical protein